MCLFKEIALRINVNILYYTRMGMKGADKIRQQREWYPGASYHIMQRGIRRMEIFKESMNYQFFYYFRKKLWRGMVE